MALFYTFIVIGFNMSVNKKQLRELIKETLIEIDAYNVAAVNLLMGTAAQESLLGHYIKQVRGPALGMFQMEPATFQDISNRLNRERLEKILQLLNLKSTPSPKDMMYNLKLAIIMARYKYLLIPEGLPASHDIEGLARYWKKYYNTPLGRGTENEFIKNYNRYVL